MMSNFWYAVTRSENFSAKEEYNYLLNENPGSLCSWLWLPACDSDSLSFQEGELNLEGNQSFW